MTRVNVQGPDEFWCLMCQRGFVRLDRHTGAIGNTVYTTTVAPEDVPGFIERIKVMHNSNT